MTFTIDTGLNPRPLLQRLPTWFLDGYPDADAMPDSRIAHDYGQLLIVDFAKPKKSETVRKHLLGCWWFLPILAEHHPEVFDELLCTFAHRVEGVEE